MHGPQMLEVEPEPRLDTVVELATGERRRRTDYAAAVWLDGKPFVSGLTLGRDPRAPKGIRVPNFDAVFFLPDSLPYVGDRLGESTVVVEVSLRASGEVGAVISARAAFVADPSGEPTWIQLAVSGHLGWPAAFSYRVVALTPLDAVG